MRYLSFLGIVAAFFLVRFAGNPIDKSVVGFTNTHPNTLAWVVCGGVIVFIFYWIKFNEWAGEGQAPPGFRPRPVRHFTTWIRYLGWNSLYGSIMAGAYCTIVFFPDIVLQFVNLFANNIQLLSLNDLFRNLQAVATNPEGTLQLVPYAVMVTTAVWAGMPPFSRFEERIRLRWQENASIPLQARQLMEAFEEEIDGETNFTPDPKTVRVIIKKLDNTALTIEDFFQPGHDSWFLYGRVNYLFYMLEKHNRSPLFSRLATRYGSELTDLEKTMGNLHAMVEQRIGDIIDLCEHDQVNGLCQVEADQQPGFTEKRRPTLKQAELWLDNYLGNASKAERAYFKWQKESLLQSLYQVSQDITQLIVCGVLAVGRSIGRRRALLSSFGLKNTDRISIQLDFVTLVLISLSTVGIVFFCSTVYQMVQKYLKYTGDLVPEDLTNVLIWSVFAGLMHLTAIGGGYIVQRALENDRESIRTGEDTELPFRTQMAEAIWAALFGVSLNVYLIGFFLALNHQFHQLVDIWWWAIVPGVTAFFAALYTQNVRRSEPEMRKLLYWQGALTGVMALFIFTIINYEQLIRVDNVEKGTDIMSYVVFGIYSVITTVILGTALGKSLNIWVVAERYSGNANRRSNMRKNYFYKHGKWRSDDGEITVRAMSVSDSGAELKSAEPLAANSTGLFQLSGHGAKKAVVLRNDDNDNRVCFVKFVGDIEPDYSSVGMT